MNATGRGRRRCVIDPRFSVCSPLARRLTTAISLTIAAVMSIPDLADARRKKRPPPLLELEVRRGKTKLGTEALRKKVFEKIVNYSTTAKLRDKGRRFKQRTHTKLDHQDHVVQYNRWVDVKGASTRAIVFQVKGAWKLRTGDTTQGGFKLKELVAKAPVVLLDERSPTLVHVAIDRAAGRDTHFVRVDNGTSGPLTVRVESLVAAKSGKTFKRYTLTGEGLKATLLRNSEGKTVHVQGPGAYTGHAKGFKMPAKFEAAAADPAAPAAPTAPDAPGAPGGDGAAPDGDKPKPPADAKAPPADANAPPAGGKAPPTGAEAPAPPAP